CRWRVESIGGRSKLSPRCEGTERMELILDDEGTHTLFGNHDENLRMLEDEFDVQISSRGNEIFVKGEAASVAPVEKLLAQMQKLIEQCYPLQRSDVSPSTRLLRDLPQP